MKKLGLVAMILCIANLVPEVQAGCFHKKRAAACGVPAQACYEQVVKVKVKHRRMKHACAPAQQACVQTCAPAQMVMVTPQATPQVIGATPQLYAPSAPAKTLPAPAKVMPQMPTKTTPQS